MPSALRSRIALFALLGAFLIPIGMSSLRGLTHVLTCQDAAETPFSMIIPEDGDPLIQSSTRFERGEEAGLCGGLTLDLGARVTDDEKIAFEVPITNNTKFGWRGTVKLELGKTSIPVDIGSIAAGDTETDTVEFDLDPGTFELNGSLLIGP